MLEKIRELRIEVYGRVQGVGFRDSVRRFANSFGLKGFVMNNEDGSVAVLAQGSEKVLEELISFIQKEPGFSKIGGLNYRIEEMRKEYPDFRVVREKNFIFNRARSLTNLWRSFVGFQRIPGHVALIPDGNRRWARFKGLDATFGHYKAGAYSNIEELFREAQRLRVKYMSIWGFSSENWKRSASERKAIFDLILSGVERFLRDAHKNKMRFRHIGRKDRLPKKLAEALTKLENETKNYDKFNIQLCLDYGGRDEVIRAVNKILKSSKKEIDENEFSKFLDGYGIPDPDLIIRTGGEKRLSGFMPFQSSYSELYFSELYFPDFNVKELRKAIREYGKRRRRFGGN